MRLKKATIDRYIEVLEAFKHHNGIPAGEPVESRDVVEWGMGRGDLSLSRGDQAELHRARLAAALQARKLEGGLRAYHCVTREVPNDEGKTVQRTFWNHIDDADDQFILDSLLQRRDQIRKDIAALREERDAINERRRSQGKRPIQLRLEFWKRDDPQED